MAAPGGPLITVSFKTLPGYAGGSRHTGPALAASSASAQLTRRPPTAKFPPINQSQFTIHHSHAPLPLTPLNSAIFLTALMMLVSIWVTDDLELSLPKISGLILGFGTFFAGVHFRIGLAN